MNRGLFSTQLNETEDLLRRLGLLSRRIEYPRYSECTSATFRHLNYLKTWELCFEKEYYDLRLTDDALIQFRYETPNSFSYAYLESPYIQQLLTFDEFFEQTLNEVESRDQYLILEDYDIYQANLRTKEIATPIRYDFSPNDYTSGCHPASHFHFGFGNQSRVGTRRILKPLSFALFVLRQFYPEYWRRLLDEPQIEILCRNVNANLGEIPTIYWGLRDTLEMTLS